MSVTADICSFESLLLLNHVRYGNMNGATLLQIVRFYPIRFTKSSEKLSNKAKSRFYNFLTLQLFGEKLKKPKASNFC